MSDIQQIKIDWLLKTLEVLKTNHGLNQKDFAEKMNKSGQQVSNMKAGRDTISDAFINEVLEKFKVDPPYGNKAYKIRDDQFTMMANENQELRYSLREVNDMLLKNLNDLRENINDLRRETKGVYDHVSTLKHVAGINN